MVAASTRETSRRGARRARARPLTSRARLCATGGRGGGVFSRRGVKPYNAPRHRGRHGLASARRIVDSLVRG